MLPHAAVGVRGVDVAAPNPAAHLPQRRKLRQVDRLRIVDEDNVRLEVQPRGVLPVDLVVQVEIAFFSETGRPCKPL